VGLGVVVLEPAVQAAEMQAQRGVAEHLVGVTLGQVEVADVAEGGPGRGVDVQAEVAAELADAEEMSAVGDDDDALEVLGGGDGGEAGDLLLGVGGTGLGDDAVVGHAVGEQVVTADGAFGVAGVLVAAAAEGDDERRDLALVQGDGVIEARVKDRRGVAEVLGGTEDGDGVGGLRVVFAGDGVDLDIEPTEPHGGEQKEDPKGAPRQVAGA
jgi:hypothetical protein